MKRLVINFFVLICFIYIGCSPKNFKESWTKKEAPEIFKARFETTKGNFEIEARKEWSPKAVNRLYQLISSGFYNDIAVYRVVPNFVAQFGIHNDSLLNESWSAIKIPDEKVVEKNFEGTISFARGGKESRTTQLYINLKSNSPRLDTLNYNEVIGFPVVAKITNGIDNVKLLFDEYSEKPGRRQDSIHKYGNKYLRKHFPKLDYIKTVYLLKE